MKRIISLMLTLAVTLSLLVLLAGAASTPEEALGEVNIYSGGYSMKYLAVNGKVQTQSYTYFLYENSAGETQEIPAYCVNPNQYGVPQTVPEGESIRYLAEEKASDPKVVGLIANMYPHRSLEELGLDNKYQAFYAGKIALWCYLIPEWDISAVTVAPGLTGTEREIGENILNAAVQIYTEGTRWTSVAEPQLTTSPDQETAYPVTIDGAAYRQQVFTVTSPTWVDGQAVNVSFQDPSAVPSGTRIVDENNQDITQVKVSNTGNGYKGTFKVLYPEDSVAGQSGSVQLSLSADVYQYVVFYALCQETDQYGNLQSYLCDTDPKTSLLRNAISNYSDTDEPDDPDEPTPPPSETALKITKYEAGTTVTLSGATFEVVGPDGDTIGVYTTPESGSITIPLVEVGNYTIYERVPPEYHLMDEEPVKQVTVKYGEVAEVAFENEPYGDLRIEKIDGATGASLAGARIQIKHIESGATYTGTTGTGGSYTFTELKPGAYEIRELSAPEGWQRDPQTYTTTVVAGDCVTYTLKNEALPGLKIIKYDRESHETMSGVTFRIWWDGELLGDYETDALGEILLTNCVPGTYRVQEVDTGDSGHLVDSTPQEIELKAGDSIKELYFFNDQKPGIWLVKVDSADPSKVIPNARFRIEAVDGSWGPAEFTTDQNGEIDLSELPTGAYVVTELDCPGYLIDEAQRIIQMEANQTARFVFTNSVQPSLHLIKLSSDGSRLAGVTFRIAKIEDGSRYLDRTTDENGEILISGLEPGVYSVKELDTTSDHISDPVERHVELFPGKTSTIILENDIRPNLTVVKRDADTGEPVPDTVFLVEAADGHSVDEIKTG
ncbi:SpaA isopeptide-forming pilin-related protein, partial [Flavonifractor plautii]